MMNVMRGVVERHEEKSVIVRTRDGILLRGVTRQWISEGKEVEVAVRPEKIHLSQHAPTPAENCLEGHVAQVVYQGASTEYYVALASGSRLRVVAQNTSTDAAEAPADRGAPVFVHWATNATLVMVAAAAEMPRNHASASG
jgi:ABC-type Fe3+/spermidine/putrescine transport system ATPase subunit